MNPLMKKLLANSTTKNASIMTESDFFNKKDHIPTEIPIIDLAFSGEINGGLSTGLTILAGESGVYKSLLSLVCVKAYLKKYSDAVCILYDSEGGMTPDYLQSQGIDPNRVLHVPIEHLEMLKFDIVKQLKEIQRGDKVILVIDSIGNTGSMKEIDDALAEKSVAEMSRAKVIKGLFRMITPSLVAKDIPCVAICHTYSEIGSMYPRSIISGGCLQEGTEIIMADGSYRQIQDVAVGEFVKTLDGNQEVTHVWNPDTLADGTPECYELEFADGYKVTCSARHKFLIDGKWVQASDLVVGEYLTMLDQSLVKLVSITNVGHLPVYDISVAGVEHYILKNGLVSHNTGLIYSANQAFIISKSQEKDGTDLAGWNFTLNVEKSRFVRQKSKFKFTVRYDKGLQKFSGLLDLAVETGMVIKPSKGWYSRVNDDGEVEDRKWRESQSMCAEFWEPLLTNKKFLDAVSTRYKLSGQVVDDGEEDTTSVSDYLDTDD